MRGDQVDGAEPVTGTPGPGGDAWRALMDSANDAYVAITATGEVVEWNRRAEDIFGWSRDEAVGVLLGDLIIPEEFRAAHREGLRRFVATGRGEVAFQRLELPALHRDGSQRDVVFTILPARTPAGEWQFHAFLHDVTEDRRQQRYLRLLQDVAMAANEAAAVEPAVRAVLADVREVSGSELGHVYLVDGDDGRLKPSGWWSPGPKEPLGNVTAATSFAVGQGLPGRAAASGRPAWISDIRGDADFPRADGALASGMLAAFAFPVTTQDRTVAVIELFRDRPSEPEPELLEVMETVGAQLGRVFERQAALEGLRDLAAEREAIVAIVGHELRGPLAAAHTATGLIRDEVADVDLPSGTHLLELLDRQLGRLRRLVDMFLTAQRLETGSLRVRPERVELRTVAEQVVSDGGFADVTVEIPPGTVALVDPDHAAQLIWNLVSNATRHGRPPVRVGAVEVRGTRVVVSVRDAGPGVTEEVRPRLFERFARTNRSPGSGLGLSIVRGLARANGGDATYVTGGPDGHAFLIELPRAG